MKSKYILVMLLFLMPAMAVEIYQSFRGEGQWSSSMNLGTVSSEMAGSGNMSYAAQAVFSLDGAVMKNGLEFDGSKGSVNIKGALGDVQYGLSAVAARNISLRTSIDTTSREETQDSTIGELLLYSVKTNGLINGLMKELSTEGTSRGRPIPLASLEGAGIFQINSSVFLKQYQAIKTNEASSAS